MGRSGLILSGFSSAILHADGSTLNSNWNFILIGQVGFR